MDGIDVNFGCPTEDARKGTRLFKGVKGDRPLDESELFLSALSTSRFNLFGFCCVVFCCSL